METRFDFWQKWLFVVSIVIVLFGTFMAFFNQTPLFSVFNEQIDPVFWEGSRVPEDAARFQGWAYGVWGATVAGWGIFIAFLIHFPFKRREPWAWNSLVTGLGFWYLLDTGISLYYGVVFNAVFNSLLLVAVALPLAFTRKNFSVPKTP